MWYKAEAPGSLMLMGEHAVLYDQPAIVIAISNHLRALLKPRSDQHISIFSSLGEHHFQLNSFAPHSQLQFVMAAIEERKQDLPSGFELTIENDFSHMMGFGSSAAVLVVTMAVLDQWITKNSFTKESDKANEVNYRNHLFMRALTILRKVQGKGSGADLAASIFGGVLFYQQGQIPIKKWNLSPPLLAFYSGSKVPTAQAIEKVSVLYQQKPRLISQIFNTMGELVLDAAMQIEREDWQNLGTLMNVNQGLLNALGVSNLVLEQLIDVLRDSSSIYGAKISGAGLGDCVIGLGKLDLNSSSKKNDSIKNEHLSVIEVDQQGLCYDQ